MLCFASAVHGTHSLVGVDSALQTELNASMQSPPHKCFRMTASFGNIEASVEPCMISLREPVHPDGWKRDIYSNCGAIQEVKTGLFDFHRMVYIFRRVSGIHRFRINVENAIIIGDRGYRLINEVKAVFADTCG